MDSYYKTTSLSLSPIICIVHGRVRDVLASLLTFRSVTNKNRKRTDIVVGFHPRIFQDIVSTGEREYII